MRFSPLISLLRPLPVSESMTPAKRQWEYHSQIRTISLIDPDNNDYHHVLRTFDVHRMHDTFSTKSLQKQDELTDEHSA